MYDAQNAARLPLKSSGAHAVVEIEVHDCPLNAITEDMPVTQSFKLAKPWLERKLPASAQPWFDTSKMRWQYACAMSLQASRVLCGLHAPASAIKKAEYLSIRDRDAGGSARP